MPRLVTTFLALLVVALALFGTVSAVPSPQDPATDNSQAAPSDNSDGDVAPSPSPAADAVASDTAASPSASADTPAATGGPSGVQTTAPGDPNGPELEISEPSGSTVVKPGDDLAVTWTADSNGVWNPMTIQLMTGANKQMIPLETVGQNIDATNTTSFSFKVPDVDPYSQIYFLQFTSTGGAPSWSTRFTISGADGTTVQPPNTEVVNGENVGWGNGQLKNPGPSVVGANPTTSLGVRPTGVNGTGITLYSDNLPTGIPTDVSTHGVAAATVGALPGTNSGSLSLRPVAAVVAIVAGAALLV
ncbi:hypothetical protein CcaverHIS002_0506490 [Cutaneotrichosporon cavernicola]|uniref:Yeast cell wall synthesis Kre9/Knh1-like N-terminal domain-containing protein n=1 Tax=Cutaneotrichosporon cavernicola TaxID=279322 RepID=A0AA48L719_9TREE|nr:uncharacterized protein CcaverHIS019_0507010 [Cutaneotrichosporon cavernicola]BEI85248.1 hypothetical protein CcaverHIS002_0506490 [Cutaneotrichosporon cavernicola]BEI93073.1 hypothetical protein CcaverHIS019_0507010 [Cutaneotrichosporon cavernicola]BEJ00850.1 hypothetical protein CcaverHIS631_0507070 [Cutaneotrichosporon cavernicola]BEJ08617.1 hypothetical protein CcaverHIS641_0507110 [Cutaneotrichosporon cavernicola]